MYDDLHTSESGGRTEKSLFKSAAFAGFERLIDRDLCRLEQRWASWAAPKKTRKLRAAMRPRRGLPK